MPQTAHARTRCCGPRTRVVRTVYNGSPAGVGRGFQRPQVLAPPSTPGAGVTGALESGAGAARGPGPVAPGRSASSRGARRGSRGRSQSPAARLGAAAALPAPGVHPSRGADTKGPRGHREEGPAPGAPLRPAPASVSRSLTLLAGGSGRGRSAASRGQPLAPGELGARRRQPAPAPAARPAPAAPGPPPQSLRPARGRTLAERRRSGPGCASPASTCPTSGASAQRQRRAPRPAPPRPLGGASRERRGSRVRTRRLLRWGRRRLPGGDWLGAVGAPPPPGPGQVGSRGPSSGSRTASSASGLPKALLPRRGDAKAVIGRLLCVEA